MNPECLTVARVAAEQIAQARASGDFSGDYRRARDSLLKATRVGPKSAAYYLPDGTRTVLDYYAVDRWVLEVTHPCCEYAEANRVPRA